MLCFLPRPKKPRETIRETEPLLKTGSKSLNFPLPDRVVHLTTARLSGFYILFDILICLIRHKAWSQPGSPGRKKSYRKEEKKEGRGLRELKNQVWMFFFCSSGEDGLISILTRPASLTQPMTWSSKCPRVSQIYLCLNSRPVSESLAWIVNSHNDFTTWRPL